jgi:hypothetical protein
MAGGPLIVWFVVLTLQLLPACRRLPPAATRPATTPTPACRHLPHRMRCAVLALLTRTNRTLRLPASRHVRTRSRGGVAHITRAVAWLRLPATPHHYALLTHFTATGYGFVWTHVLRVWALLCSAWCSGLCAPRHRLPSRFYGCTLRLGGGASACCCGLWRLHLSPIATCSPHA